MATSELKNIKRLLILNFAEIQHLKKIVLKHLEEKDDIYDYANSLGEYMTVLDSKMRNLIKDYPDLAD